MYLHATALAAGHAPQTIESMPMKDLELLAFGAFIQRHINFGGDL